MESAPNGSHTESREATPAPEVYFSVSNLVRRCYVERRGDKGEFFDIAILNGKTKDGAPRFQAIGGGAKLTDAAIEQLRSEYPNIRFRGGEEGDDARFYIDVPEQAREHADDTEEQRMKATRARNAFIHEVMDRFNDPNSSLFKDAVGREIVEELTEAKGSFSAPLTEDEAASIKTQYEASVSPIQWGATTSGRAGSSAYYYRTFHLYNITVSEETFEKLRASGRIRILSPEDAAAVRVATETGEAAARLSDGSVLVENVFPE